MVPADVFDVVPHLRPVERSGGGRGELPLGGIQQGLLFLGGFALLWQGHPRMGCDDVRVKGVQQSLGGLTGGGPGDLLKLLPLRGCHLGIQADDAAGQGGESVLILRPQRHIHHQFFQGDGGLALQGTGVRFLGSGDAHRVHDDKVVLVLCGGGSHLLQIILAQRPGSPALHLLEIVLAPHVPHEDQALDRLHVRSGGNHVHSDGNSGIETVAEIRKGSFRVIRRIGDLLTELIALAKLFPDDLDDVVRVAVSLGKNQRFGDLASAGKQDGVQVFPERPNHSPYLAGVDDIPVKAGGCIIYILVHLLPSFLPGQAVPVFDLLFHNVSAVLSYLGFDEEDVLPHVDSVNDGLLSGILADHILMEKGKGTFVRCGRQANDKCVKIFQHLTPDIVNRSMALVHNDAVKELRRIFFVVDHFLWRFAVGGDILAEWGLLCGLVQVLALQNRVHPLDGADVDLRISRHPGGFQAVHAVDVGKWPGIVVGGIGQELPLRLLPQTFGVHQEQNTVHLSEFQQAVCGGDGGKGLARASGHLHQCPRPVFRERTV